MPNQNTARAPPVAIFFRKSDGGGEKLVDYGGKNRATGVVAI